MRRNGLVLMMLLVLSMGVSILHAQSNAPQIVRFESSIFEVSRAEMREGTARVPVSWTVENRLPTMNLIFDQLFPDGSIENIELPRTNPWVNSNESGMVAPRDPGDEAEEIVLLVRLYTFADNEILDAATLTIPVVDSHRVTLNEFTVTPEEASAGDDITVTWDVSGVDSIQLSISHIGNMRTVQPTSYASVGSVTLSAPDGVETANVVLTAGDLWERRTITLTCSIEWFSDNDFEGGCPETEAQMVTGVYQQFEHGYMLRQSTLTKIWFYVSTTDTYYVRPLDMVRDAQLFSGDTPEGFIRPEGDFGTLWEGSAFVRDELGWAISPPETYTMQYQQSTYAMGTRGDRYRMFTLPDGTPIVASIGEF